MARHFYTGSNYFRPETPARAEAVADNLYDAQNSLVSALRSIEAVAANAVGLAPDIVKAIDKIYPALAAANLTLATLTATAVQLVADNPPTPEPE
jgi:ABC-type transporter Mla subunit MlaD